MEDTGTLAAKKVIGSHATISGRVWQSRSCIRQRMAASHGLKRQGIAVARLQAEACDNCGSKQHTITAGENDVPHLQPLPVSKHTPVVSWVCASEMARRLQAGAPSAEFGGTHSVQAGAPSTKVVQFGTIYTVHSWQHSLQPPATSPPPPSPNHTHIQHIQFTRGSIACGHQPPPPSPNHTHTHTNKHCQAAT